MTAPGKSGELPAEFLMVPEHLFFCFLVLKADRCVLFLPAQVGDGTRLFLKVVLLNKMACGSGQRFTRF